MRKRRALGLVAVAGVLALAWGGWFWTRMTPPVTEAEARRYLDRIVSAALAHDVEKVCALNGSNLQCKAALDYIGGPETLPTATPTVVGTRYHRKEPGGTAGRILVVEGLDGRGRTYRTEVFVFRENRFNFKAINGVFWSGAKFYEGDTISPPTEPTPT